MILNLHIELIKLQNKVFSQILGLQTYKLCLVILYF